MTMQLKLHQLALCEGALSAAPKTLMILCVCHRQMRSLEFQPFVRYVPHDRAREQVVPRVVVLLDE